MREFRKITSRNNRPQVWYIGVDPKDSSSYIILWGMLNGVLQKTSNTPGDCGVKGHSDYQTPEKYAVFCMEREIRKKEEHGYVEYIDGKPIKDVATSINFTKPLPKNLCFYKPKKDVSNKKLSSIKKPVWTIKKDGMMHVAVKTKGLWDIYTRRMDIATEKFPHIVESLSELNIPNNSILLGEIISCLNGKDDFVSVSKICRSDPDLALAYQGLKDFPKGIKDINVLGKVQYYIFDIAYFNGKDIVSNLPVGDRIKLITKISNKYIIPLQIINTNFKEDLSLAKSLGIEGFVILDINSKYGNKAYSFDGKAQRPEGIYKRKPKFDEEFIIIGTYEGSGRNRGKLGGFLISQIHPKTGKIIDCGKCGGGFSDEQRVTFWSRRNEIINKTIKVEFDSRQLPKNGAYALRFPIFKGFSDKTIEECIAQFLCVKK